MKGIYFFLSYAHSPPISDVTVDPDHWVKVFYVDLRARVERRARRTDEMEIGFVDYELPPDSDWKAQLSRALGAAEVFVPLYSPGYLARSWPLSERDAFRQRIRSAAPRSGDGHVQPVLWSPVPASRQNADVAEALRLAPGIPAYAENGLRAMLMLKTFRAQYHTIVDKLAREIVRVAETSPLGPSVAPAPSGTAHPTQSGTPFVIAVAAPTRATRPPDRPAETYGASSTDWRPFGEAQARPIAEYAANVAERFGLPTRIVEYPRDAALFDKYPGLLLIDPWILDAADGRAGIRSAVAHLSEWVTPLIVVNQRDPQYAERGAALGSEVVSILDRTESSGTAEPHRVPLAREVEEVEKFVRLMPTVVAQTRRTFLKVGPGFPPKGPAPDRPWQSGNNAPSLENPGSER